MNGLKASVFPKEPTFKKLPCFVNTRPTDQFDVIVKAAPLHRTHARGIYRAVLCYGVRLAREARAMPVWTPQKGFHVRAARVRWFPTRDRSREFVRRFLKLLYLDHGVGRNNSKIRTMDWSAATEFVAPWVTMASVPML